MTSWHLVFIHSSFFGNAFSWNSARELHLMVWTTWKATRVSRNWFLRRIEDLEVKTLATFVLKKLSLYKGICKVFVKFNKCTAEGTVGKKTIFKGNVNSEDVFSYSFQTTVFQPKILDFSTWILQASSSAALHPFLTAFKPFPGVGGGVYVYPKGPLGEGTFPCSILVLLGKQQLPIKLARTLRTTVVF